MHLAIKSHLRLDLIPLGLLHLIRIRDVNPVRNGLDQELLDLGDDEVATSSVDLRAPRKGLFPFQGGQTERQPPRLPYVRFLG